MKRFNIFSSITGNIIEWYDFTLFVSLAPVIADIFFPYKEKNMALLSTFFIFAMGFLARPVGAVLFGQLGDRVGRVKTLQITLLLLSLSTLCIAFLPLYKTWGIEAPLFLMMLRIIQGICMGGGFTGIMIYLTEKAPSDHRAWISCIANNSSNVGVLLAMGTSALFSNLISSSDFHNYGWRFPFLIGGIVGLVGFLFFRNIEETDVFTTLNKTSHRADRASLLAILKHDKKKMMEVCLLLLMAAAANYTLIGYLATYLHVYLHYSLAHALHIQIFFITITFILIPLFSKLSDRYGRKVTLSIAAFGYIICSVPCFYYVTTSLAWWPLLLLIIFYCFGQSTTPSAVVEMFPAQNRYTGISVGYNVTMALVGGTTPLINTWLIQKFNNPAIIAYYLIACATLSLSIILFKLPKTLGKKRDLL